MAIDATLPWKRIDPISASGWPRDSRFDAVDALRDEWALQLKSLSPAEFRWRRQRSLRKHAVDTGVIAQLYDVQREQAQSLAAEGIVRDALARTTTLPDEVMRRIEAQFVALEMAPELISGDRPLTTSFIRELHRALTQTQATYRARDREGVDRDIPLRHGDWKDQANAIALGNGSERAACPPEHVASEVEQLLKWWSELEASTEVHALVKIAWFHHRLVQIHPFADGNGRVARALTSMLMQKLDLPPLVIGSEHREAYFDALARADEGSLSGLANLLLEVASATMLRELEPREQEEAHDPLVVARSIALAVSARKAAEREAIAFNQRNFDQLSWFIDRMVVPWFTEMRTSLLDAIARDDVESVADLKVLRPIIDQPLVDPWIETHIVAAAQRVKQSYEVRSCVGAVQLKLCVEGEWMVLGVATYRLSPGSNVLVAVPFASDTEFGERFWYSAHDSRDELDARSTEVISMLATCLGLVMEKFKRRVVPSLH